MTFHNAKIVDCGVSYSEYSKQSCERGDPGFVMSRGQLMDFLACPHKWRMGFQSPDTKASEWGALIDVLLLSPKLFNSQFAVCPEKYPAVGMQCPKCKSITDSKSCRKCSTERVEIRYEKDWDGNATYCQEWRAEQFGKRIIKKDTKKSADQAVKTLLANDTVNQLVSCSKTQVMVTAEYRDRATGLVIPVKALIDMVPDAKNHRFGRKLADLKTSHSASPHDFESQIFNCDYDAQAAMYLDLFTSATNEDRIEWIFALQESGEPYEVADPLPMLSSEFLEIGRAKYTRALKLYAHCLATDTWPSYSPGLRTTLNDYYLAEPKPWMTVAIMDQPFDTPTTLPALKTIDTELKEVIP